MTQRKRFIVIDPDGNEVKGVEYPSRRSATLGGWAQPIAECGYTVKRINLELKPSHGGTPVWERKGTQWPGTHRQKCK